MATACHSQLHVDPKGRALAADEADEIQVEWRLTPRLHIESSAASDASAGADLVWTLDY